MFKRIFWKFLPRYGMKKYYSRYPLIIEMALRIYRRDKYTSDSSYYGGPNAKNRIHIAPRGDCGARGKVLCYEEIHGRWVYKGKHRRPKYISDGNLCK